MKKLRSLSAEAWLAGGLFLLAVLGLLFMSQLVAPPKVLFGRSLTAIPPSLFPTLVLGAMAILGGMLLYSLRGSLYKAEDSSFDRETTVRVVLLFVVMFAYALAMVPLGFFISSALAMAAIAWLAGNRSILQICVVSIFSPIALYLISTRGLAVSLPELSAIEFLYADIFDASVPPASTEESASQ